MAVPVGCWPNANAADISRPAPFLSFFPRLFFFGRAPCQAPCGPMRPHAAPCNPMRPRATPCGPMRPQLRPQLRPHAAPCTGVFRWDPRTQTQETGIQEGLAAPCTAHGAAPRPGRAFPSGTALTRPHSPAAGASQLLDGEISTCVGAANWLLIATNYRARASVPAPPALLGRSALTSAAIYTPTTRPLPLLPSFCVRAPTACRTRVVARCGWGGVGP
jgi:hypothetical protein